ncbi:Detected protein of unknown function [Hibiscus syriacus]|uniref:Uncharacterized protein n=1 Tax=Hibiscus syriacus TaxID=106335 RepID=A0A6A2ZWI2_HIBSY|nr:Detected protein of unknown function [Hibiscus syriacus]
MVVDHPVVIVTVIVVRTGFDSRSNLVGLSPLAVTVCRREAIKVSSDFNLPSLFFVDFGRSDIHIPRHHHHLNHRPIPLKTHLHRRSVGTPLTFHQELNITELQSNFIDLVASQHQPKPILDSKTCSNSNDVPFASSSFAANVQNSTTLHLPTWITASPECRPRPDTNVVQNVNNISNPLTTFEAWGDEATASDSYWRDITESAISMQLSPL